jgi:hypothetical protein
VAKESIFSGLNNLVVCTVLTDEYADCFGFTQSDVDALLIAFGREGEREAFRHWYNGYVFGGATVYNPWSILHALRNPNAPLQPHWVNTSDNALLFQEMDKHAHLLLPDMLPLLEGNRVKKVVDVHTTVRNLGRSEQARNFIPESILWGFFLMAGYVTSVHTTYVDDDPLCMVCLPNRELHSIFKKFTLHWSNKTKTPRSTLAVHELVHGAVSSFVNELHAYVQEALSFFDVTVQTAELVYHSFMLGMLLQLRDTHEIRSNRESGQGRPDVLIIPRQRGRGVVIEFKQCVKETDLPAMAEDALTQIKTKSYDAVLREDGIEDIVHVGMAFFGKRVHIVAEAAQ